MFVIYITYRIRFYSSFGDYVVLPVQSARDKSWQRVTDHATHAVLKSWKLHGERIVIKNDSNIICNLYNYSLSIVIYIIIMLIIQKKKTMLPSQVNPSPL